MSSAKVLKSSPDTTTSDSMPPSHSAEKIANNDDLLAKILVRLPIRSLLKFKSVSKHWLSLISNPDFSHRRSPYPTVISGLFFRRPRSTCSKPEFGFIDFDNPSHKNPSSFSGPGPFRSLNFLNNRARVTILQSCNGLLLCSTFPAQHSKRNYYVYNPTTKQYTTLPPLPFSRRTSVYNIALAFDPLKSPHFKIVFVRLDDAYMHYRIEIYSSEHGTWRLSALPPFFSTCDFRFVRGVYCNGAVHWVSSPSNTYFYFKIEEEELFPMSMLRPAINEDLDDIGGEESIEESECREHRYFGESRGHLYLIDYMSETGETHLNVFEMESNYSKWNLKFRVDLVEISNVFPEIIVSSSVDHPQPVKDYVFSVLCVVSGELDEDSYLVLNIPGKVLRYNFSSKTFYKLYNTESSEKILGSGVVYQYIESLACV